MTLTVTFSTDHLNLSPGTAEHARQVLISWLKGKGVTQEHEDNGEYVWGWREIEAKH